LHRDAREKEFIVGLNGFATTWDGKDNAGATAPAGKYLARGFAVGAVAFEGEAFHFNDWLDDDATPRLKQIADIHADADGLRAIGIVVNGSAVEFTIDPDGRARGFRVSQSERFIHPMDEPDEESRWFGVRESAESFANAPVSALDGDDAVLAIAGGRLLLCENESWRWLELPTLRKPIHACLGRGRTLWVVAGAEAGVEVQQYSFDGEFQRRLAIAPEDPMPVRIAASPTSDSIALIEESDGISRTRMLALVASAVEGNSTWKETFSKTIRASGDFARIKDQLRTSAGAPFRHAERINVRLLPNPLVRNVAGSVDLMVDLDEHGSFLRTFDGLPLKRITETPHLRWAAMMREAEGNGIIIFQSDGAVVEEFKARKLGRMMAFDVGEVERR
jgi:hypothetical protein